MRYVFFFMPVAETQSRVRKVLDFSPEELSANKNGRTTMKRSFSAPLPELGIPGIWLTLLVFAVLAVLEWIFDWLPISPWLIFLGGSFLVISVIILSWKRRGSADTERIRAAVIPTEGEWKLYRTKRRGKPRLQVGTVRFRLKREEAQELEEIFQEFDGIGGVVYHRPGTRNILSAQVVDVAWKVSDRETAPAAETDTAVEEPRSEGSSSEIESSTPSAESP